MRLSRMMVWCHKSFFKHLDAAMCKSDTQPAPLSLSVGVKGGPGACRAALAAERSRFFPGVFVVNILCRREQQEV
jgi:hypothetical protein